MGQRLCPGKTTALYEPKKITILGQEVGLSGVMDPGGGAYGINSDIFHLKVNECSAQLYVNEGLGHPYNTAVMRRILNTLGTVIIDPDSGDPLVPDDPSNPDDGLGDQIMNYRPPDGYKTKFELREKLGKDLYNKVKDFLCVHTWCDNQVVNPVPLSGSNPVKLAYHTELFETPTHGVRGNARLTRFCEDNFLADDVIVYSQKELIPTHIEVTSRAPININTVPRQILIAVLQGLEGFFVMEQKKYEKGRSSSYEVNLLTHIFSYPAYSPVGGLTKRKVVGDIGVLFRTRPIDQQTTEKLADLLIKQRPFLSWDQFNRLIDSIVWHPPDGPDVDEAVLYDGRGAEELNLVESPEVYYSLKWDHFYRHYASQAMADVIKANFNPNLHLNELNPDAILWQWVDKTDLIKNSTEFCFLPTGYFEIESVGRILRAEWQDGRFHISPYLLIMKDSFEYNNQVMGQRRLTVEVKLWDLYRQTSQKDFYRGSFSTNTNQQFQTCGNWACESGPALNNGTLPFEIDHEGYITLATYGGSLPAGQHRIKGLAYTRDPEPVPASSSEVPNSSTLVPDHFDYIDADRRDGFYADKDTRRIYYMKIPKMGVFSYWLKPALHPELDGYTRTISSINRAWSYGLFDHDVGGPSYSNILGLICEDTPPNYTYRLPYSMRFRFAGYRYKPAWGEFPVETYFAVSTTLNHLHHECGSGPTWDQHQWSLLDSPLMAHRWLHVAILWRFELENFVFSNCYSAIYVNTRHVSDYLEDKGVDPPMGLHTYHDEGTGSLGMAWSGRPNPFVLGGDRWCQRPCHYTIDEFYFMHGGLPTIPVPCPCQEARACKSGTGSGDCSICPPERRCKGGEGTPCPCPPESECKNLDPCTCSFFNKCRWGWWGSTCKRTCKCGRVGSQCVLEKCVCSSIECEACPCEGDGWLEECDFECSCDDCILGCVCENGTIDPDRPPLPEGFKSQWRLGRYYRGNDAEFISPDVDFIRRVGRVVPEPNKIEDPYGNLRWGGKERLKESEARQWLTQTWYNPAIKILGVTWTAYTKEVMDHHGTEYGEPVKWLDAQVELSLERKEGNNWLHIAGPFLNADAGWAPVFAKVPSGKIRYRVRFNTRAPLDAILLETPVLDDVTIYWASWPEFFSWMEGY
jgi:hypothetical protein